MFSAGGALRELQNTTTMIPGAYAGKDWGVQVGSSAMTGTRQAPTGQVGYGWRMGKNGQLEDPGGPTWTPFHGASAGQQPVMPYMAGFQAPPTSMGYNQSRAMGRKPGDTPRSTHPAMAGLSRLAGRGGYTGVAPASRGGGYR